MRQCPSWLVGKELELCVSYVGVLVLEFFYKLNRIVVSDNLLFMRAKILRQNMQQTVLGLLKVNVELLLLFLIHIIEVKERAPGQTPPVLQRFQNFGRLISQQRVGGPKEVPQLDLPFPPARGARRRGRVIELADFQRIVAGCLVVVGHVHPRCSGKRDRVLFIGTQFSILYTSMYSPAGRNEPGKVGRKMQASQCQNNEVVNRGDPPYTP
jgi:hypothetical protein